MPIEKEDVGIINSGERLVPDYSKATLVYGEHIARYKAACNIVKGKEILDIATGTGYGAAILAQGASRVYGVDIDQEAVKYAKKHFSHERIKFLLGDGEKIPLDSNSVDVVISFETIEHIKNYEQFMKEIKRVLRPEGLLILSTPNDAEYPEGNHFHLHEFEEKELGKLVKKFYKHSKSYYQGTWLYNAILEGDMLSSGLDQKIESINLAPIGKSQCTYFYMLCSDRKIVENIEPLAVLSEHWSERKKLEREAEEDLLSIERVETIHKLQKYIVEKDQHITNLQTIISRHEKAKISRKVRLVVKKIRSRFVEKKT